MIKVNGSATDSNNTQCNNQTLCVTTPCEQTCHRFPNQMYTHQLILPHSLVYWQKQQSPLRIKTTSHQVEIQR